MIAIKQLGTNGGGYYNSNSAVPFENPTPTSNFLEMLSILLIPSGRSSCSGGWAGTPACVDGLAAMFAIFAIGVGIAFPAEQHGSKVLPRSGVNITRATDSGAAT